MNESDTPTQREPSDSGNGGGQPPMSDGQRTVREGGGVGASPTVRGGQVPGRHAGSGSVPTSREEAAGGWVPVPLSLQERYRYVGQIVSSGGEANLYRVRPIDDPGRDLLLKLYLGSVQLDRDALERISSMHPRHVVGVVHYGTVAETGHWFEVQEYLEHGDLLVLLESHGSLRGQHRALDPGLVRALLGQLHDALRAFHRVVGPHHDLKPSNVLVRTPPPGLEIVLADFGLAMATDRSVIYQSRRAGTIAYDSPESLGAGQGGPGRDWWALGMTIAHLAGGRHPFEHPTSGTMLTDAAIRDHLHNRRPIDFGAVSDPELVTLCQGLTRYDPTHRWGDEQVAAWLRGEPVSVMREQPAAAPTIPTAPSAAVAVGVEFTGRRYPSREALARALANDWRAAAVVLGRATGRQSFVDEIAVTFGGHGLERLDADWAQQTASADRAVAELIVALDSSTPPVVSGWDVSKDGLAAFARAALGTDGDSQRARKTVDSLFDNHLLAVLAQLDGQEELGEIDRRWHEVAKELDQELGRAEASGLGINVDFSRNRATLLATCVGDSLVELRARRDEIVDANPDAAGHPAVSLLSRGSNATPAQLLSVILLASQAAMQVREQRERQAELEAQEERERLERERQADRESLAEAKRVGLEAHEKRKRLLGRLAVVGTAGMVLGGIFVAYGVTGLVVTALIVIGLITWWVW